MAFDISQGADKEVGSPGFGHLLGRGHDLIAADEAPDTPQSPPPIWHFRGELVNQQELETIEPVITTVTTINDSLSSDPSSSSRRVRGIRSWFGRPKTQSPITKANTPKLTELCLSASASTLLSWTSTGCQYLARLNLERLDWDSRPDPNPSAPRWQKLLLKPAERDGTIVLVAGGNKAAVAVILESHVSG